MPASHKARSACFRAADTDVARRLEYIPGAYGIEKVKGRWCRRILIFASSSCLPLFELSRFGPFRLCSLAHGTANRTD